MQEQVVAWSRIIMGLAAKEDQAKDSEVKRKHQEKAIAIYRDILTEALNETDGSLLHLLALCLQWLYHKGAVMAFIKFHHWFEVYTLEYRVDEVRCTSAQCKPAYISKSLTYYHHHHDMLCLHCHPVFSSRQPVATLHISASRLDSTPELQPL